MRMSKFSSDCFYFLKKKKRTKSTTESHEVRRLRAHREKEIVKQFCQFIGELMRVEDLNLGCILDSHGETLLAINAHNIPEQLNQIFRDSDQGTVIV